MSDSFPNHYFQCLDKKILCEYLFNNLMKNVPSISYFKNFKIRDKQEFKSEFVAKQKPAS